MRTSDQTVGGASIQSGGISRHADASPCAPQGDVGTSPLYVFASVFTAPPSEADLVGATSLVIWSITALVLVKYAIIVLRADDHGQGARLHC